MGTTQISIRLPDEVLERLETIANLADMDRSRLIINVLDEVSKTFISTKKVGLLQFSLLLRSLIDKMKEWAKEMRERKKFNDATMNYNRYIRKFPQLIGDRIFGFDKKEFFEASEGSEVPPTV